MDQVPTPSPNQRRSHRQPSRRSTKVRCYANRSPSPNLAVAVLDLSETGIRLVLNTDLPKGQELTVHLDNIAYRPIKLTAEVIWSLPTKDGNFCVGAHFQQAIRYPALISLARE